MRYGYRRIHVLLRREGWQVNVKRVRRLYKLEGLEMRLKPPRRRVMAKLRSDRSAATGPNQVWAMDWMYDGKRLWFLTVVDTWSRVCPVMRVCRSATAMEVIDALEQARRQYGLPMTIRVDQGSQFTSKELDLWAYANGVILDFSRPAKPTDNALCTELQRDGAPGVSRAALVSRSGRCPRKGRRMADRIQRSETS
jgi:putative transposase